MTKKKDKKKDKEKKKAPVVAKVKLTRVPKRIRINFQGANRRRSFAPGDILRIPEDVTEDSARSWLNSGAAVEDKSSPGPPETKVEKPENKEEPKEEEKPEEEEETKEIPVDDK